MHGLVNVALNAIGIAMLAWCVAAVPAFAQSTTVVVPGTASPYLAGMPPGSTCCASETGIDSVPAQAPVQVAGIPIVPGTALSFTATGSVSFLAGQPPTDPPDGGDFFDVHGSPGAPPVNGIAGVMPPINSLLGVFLDNNPPNTSPTPPGLDFRTIGTAFPTLAPGLKQVFFIGDGRTGRGTGAVQQFVVPAGATRLFLGTADGSGWHTNTGSFSVQVNVVDGGSLVAAVLPLSRSVSVGTPATAFATIINGTGAPLNGCAIGLATPLPLSNFLYQTTNASNNLVGTPNTPVTIPANSPQSFLISLTPSAAFGATDVAFNFQCAGAPPAPTMSGVNTLLLSAANGPVPDIIALAATPTNDGIVNLVNGSGVFSVASANVGASGNITVTLDTGAANLPLALSVCQTDAGGACVAPPGPSVALPINAGVTSTFAVFANGGPIGFDPAVNRIFVRFREGAEVRGATSVAVRTP